MKRFDIYRKRGVMSFTAEIKRELCSSVPKDDEGKKAIISALLLTSGAFSLQAIEFTSENERLARLFLRLTEDVFGVRFEMQEATLDPKRDRDKLTFSYCGEKTSEILQETGLAEGNGIFRFLETSALSYLKGAFLGSGSCTIPAEGTRTGYHLEFIFPNTDAGEAFMELLSSFELLAKQVQRGERTVVYLKSGDMLSDFCSVVGANGALKRLDDITAVRAMRNNSNRVSNCYARNADRSAIASVNQLRMIEELKKSGVYQTLAPALQEAAQIRIDYPTESLSELAERLGISKSCLNHRYRKLTEIYHHLGSTL